MNELLGHNLSYNCPTVICFYIMTHCFRLDIVVLPWTEFNDNGEFPHDRLGPEIFCSLLNETMYKRNNLRLTSLGQLKVKVEFTTVLVLLF